MKKRFKTNQKGFTLIEAVIVLSISGFVVAAIYLGYSKAVYEKKLSETKQQITEVVNNARDFFSGKNIRVFGDNKFLWAFPDDNPTNDTATLQTGNVIPSGICTGGPLTCVHPFQGQYIFDMYPDRYAPNSALYPLTYKYQLSIQLLNLPRDACINLVTYFGGSDNAARLRFFAVPSGLGNPANYALPDITPAIANNLCANNQIILRFKL